MRRDHEPERRHRETEQHHLEEERDQHQRVVGHVNEPGDRQHDQTWIVGDGAPPRHFPMMIALRRTGATSISRRNPNSRSHTIETAENIAVKSTDSASTPGT